MLLGAAGCGSRGVVRPPEPELRLALDTHDPVLQLPIYVAVRQRLFAAERLRIAITEFPDSRATTEALATGRFQLASSTFEQVLESAAQGQSFTAIGLLSRSPMLAVIAKRPLTRTELQSSGERTAIVAMGDSTDHLARYVLPWQTVPEGSAAAAATALEKHQAGAAVLDAATLRILDTRDVSYVVFADLRTVAGLLQVYGVSTYPASCLYASAPWIGSSRERVQRIAKALAMALQWIHRHKAEELAAFLPEPYRKTIDAAVVDQARPLFSEDGYIPADGAEAVRKVLKVENVPPGSYTNEFVARR